MRKELGATPPTPPTLAYPNLNRVKKRKNISREPRTVKFNILAHFNPTKPNMKKKTNLNQKPISSG